MSSRNRSSSTKTIPAEQHAALFAVINRVRMLNGWSTRTAMDLDPTIRTWADVFDRYDVPYQYYNTLYLRAFDVRQSKLMLGQEPPSFDASLLISQWTGPNGLRQELRQREIETRRTLPENAASGCELCFGTGFKRTSEERTAPVVRCDHT